MYCAKCGKPLDAGSRFCSSCGTVLQASAPPPFGGAGPVHGQLVRSRSRRMIAGVCGGFADHYGWDLNLVRVLTALLVLFTGLPLLVYIILWVVIPDGPYALSAGMAPGMPMQAAGMPMQAAPPPAVQREETVL